MAHNKKPGTPQHLLKEKNWKSGGQEQEKTVVSGKGYANTTEGKMMCVGEKSHIPSYRHGAMLSPAETKNALDHSVFLPQDPEHFRV